MGNRQEALMQEAVRYVQLIVSSYLGSAEKVFRWGLGVGVWGFTHFQVVNYLIFREKVPEFSPQSLQGSALFEVKKV
jgi:hypothetical protein